MCVSLYVWFAGVCGCVLGFLSCGLEVRQRGFAKNNTGLCGTCELFQIVVQLTEKERARHVLASHL